MYGFLKIVFVLLLCNQIVRSVMRKRHRSLLYKKALKRANDTGKKLLVIGDPENGIANTLFGTDYGYGDECLDLTGCPKAPEGVKVYKGKLEDILPTIDLSERVVFISCTLEYVDDIRGIIDRLHGMERDDLFILNIDPWTIEAWWYPTFITKEPSIKRRVHYDGKRITYS